MLPNDFQFPVDSMVFIEILNTTWEVEKQNKNLTYNSTIEEHLIWIK